MEHKLLHFETPKTPKPRGAKASIWKIRLGFALVGFVFFPNGINAQSTLNASGGSANIAGNLYAYSIGEMLLISTETSASFIVTQGVLQAHGDLLDVEENPLLDEGLSLYPNPVANTLYLHPTFPGGGELSLRLFDLRGRLIMKHKINLQTGMERQQLNLYFLQEGTYILQANLQQGKRTYEHSFKILKLGTY
ncbi:MAG TPA: T9SS type A sorting domain-containing protein [Flavobacteriaceae bacterium]|nr:T9SS type A sorting domain-containing protein [Flavobacteriaceae bacterium]